MEHGDVLRFMGIYKAVQAFKDHFELANREVMSIIIECFWSAANTFITPNDELGFCLKEFKEVVRLSILGEIFEGYFPIESELAA